MKKPIRVAPRNAVTKMRIDAKLSQGALARALGIDQSVLSRMEKGETKLPLPALLALAEVCGYEIQAVSPRGRRIALKSPTRYERVGLRVPRSRQIQRSAA